MNDETNRTAPPRGSRAPSKDRLEPPMPFSVPEHRFAGALEPPHDWEGLALAVRNAYRYVQASAKAGNEPVMLEWAETGRGFRDRLNSASEEHPGLITHSSGMRRLRVFGTFLEPIRGTVDETQTARIEAEFGRVIVTSACAAAGMPPALTLGFATLLRSGDPRERRHHEWKELAEDFPVGLEQIRSWVGRATEPTIQRFLIGLEEARAIRIVAPSELGTARPPRPLDAGSEAGAGALVDGDVAADKAIPKEPEPLEPPENFLVWLIKRSVRAGFRAHFGVLGQWDFQTLAELEVICDGIAKEIRERGPNLDKAIFAVMCGVSSLPGDMALFVPMKPTTDLWNDGFRSLKWCLLRVLDLERALSIAPCDVPSELIVEVAFPDFVAAAAEEFTGPRPHAATVVEVLTGSNEPNRARRFLEAYREWLRQFGEGWLHAVYDARFAGSFWQLYRPQSGDVVTGLASLNFDEVALAMLSYVRLSREFVREQTTLAYERLKWGEPAKGSEPSSHIGSSIARDFDSFALSFGKLQSRSEAAVGRMLAAATAVDLIDAYKELVHLRLLATLTLAGGRGHHLERMTWKAFYGHALYALFRDKDVDDYAEVRAIPVFDLLADVLDRHVADRELLVRLAGALGIEPQDLRGRPFDDRRANRGCFVSAIAVVRDGKTYLAREAIDREYLNQLVREIFGTELNVGRHTLISCSVEHGVDSSLVKVFSGHHHGHAEPFSDGGVVSPEHALALLRAALTWLCSPIGRGETDAADRYVLPLSAVCRQLPAPSREVARAPESRARVLMPPWDVHTLTALRLVAFLCDRLIAGQGPQDAAADFLLALLLLSWIPLRDIEALWARADSLQDVAVGAPIALWSREGCVAEIHRPLDAPAALALWSIRKDGRTSLPDWSLARAFATAWLKAMAPQADWSGNDCVVLEVLDGLMERYLRIVVSPFVLAAGSRTLKSATANRRSIYRLALPPGTGVDEDEVLLLPAPVIRGPRNSHLPPSALKRLIGRVHHWGDDKARLGEDFERWGRLSDEAREMKLDEDSRAIALRIWILHAASFWSKGVRGPLQVGSGSTYVRRFERGLSQIGPEEPLTKWCEEWIEWTEDLVSSVKGTALTDALITALRSFFRALATKGYSIPQELMDPGDNGAARDGQRRAAAATLLLEADRVRVNRLMADRFAQVPLVRELSAIYPAIRWAASLRAVEPAVLPLNGVSRFGDLVITSSGFSHLKSAHARRLQPLPGTLIADFKVAASLVEDAEPGSSWLFLFADDEDWAVVTDLAQSFSFAIKQVVAEPDARPHASRVVAPLETLLPGWEPMMRALITGEATVEDCAAFCRALQTRGVSFLIGVIVQVGHGHPVTYLKYYFPIWDLLLSVFARASLSQHPDPKPLLKRHLPAKSVNAFNQAKGRAAKDGVAFDGWRWALRNVGRLLGLSRLHVEEGPKAQPDLRHAQHSRGIQEKNSEMVRYLALRLTGLGAIAAAHGSALSTSTAAQLEVSLGSTNSESLRRRLQSSCTGRGQDAEVKALRSEFGTTLIARLMLMPGQLLDELGKALLTERAARLGVKSVGALAPRLLGYLGHLPVSVGLMVQFGEGQCSPEEQARLNQHRPRLRVEGGIPGLAAVPRLSVVDASDGDNRVRRARLTSNVRCVIAAIQLMRDL